MKAVILAIVLAVCGDAALNQHRITSNILSSLGELVRSSSEEVGGSVFRS